MCFEDFLLSNLAFKKIMIQDFGIILSASFACSPLHLLVILVQLSNTTSKQVRLGPLVLVVDIFGPTSNSSVQKKCTVVIFECQNCQLVEQI